MRRRPPRAAAVGGLFVLAACLPERPGVGPDGWSEEQLHRIQALSLESLPPLPRDPSNAVADDPRAVDLGHRLFFEPAFSPEGTVSCATCHQPALRFTDGLPRARGLAETSRNSPGLVGSARLPWLTWDGRKDSPWSQALGPLEDAREHGSTRLRVARVVARRHAGDFEAIFGALPELAGLPESAGPLGTDEERAAWEALTDEQRRGVERVFVGVGKAIAAYLRRLAPAPSRFDRYAAALARGDAGSAHEHLSARERLGLRVFLESACTSCHDGPLFTNGDFANLGLPVTPERPFEPGRLDGVARAVADPFNCLGAHSDADPEECEELRHVKTAGFELLGAFRVPSLRGVGATAPYMHDGRFATLAEVLAHYVAAPKPAMGHSDLVPLTLSAGELEALEAFLLALDGGMDAPARLLAPPGR